MRVAGIIRDSLVNGEGLRDVLFVQGCSHHCKGCHNMSTWSIDGGKVIDTEELADMFKDSPNNITISGGEPFEQLFSVIWFMHLIRAATPQKRFWIYTGYNYSQIKNKAERFMSEYVDVIVTGPFIERFKNLDCLYRGSSNQSLVDLQKTIANKKLTLWEERHEQ